MYVYTQDHFSLPALLTQSLISIDVPDVPGQTLATRAAICACCYGLEDLPDSDDMEDESQNPVHFQGKA